MTIMIIIIMIIIININFSKNKANINIHRDRLTIHTTIINQGPNYKNIDNE